MNIRFSLYLFLTLFLMTGCDMHARPSRNSETNAIRIERFDKALYHYMETGDTTLREKLLRDFPTMLELTGKGILNMKSPETPGFWDKLDQYYGNPDLRGVYRDALAAFDHVETIEKELGEGFAYLTESLPTLNIPHVYMHVSGFFQNVLTGENTLSLSIDKYLGADYRWYEQAFYDYQRIRMQPALAVPDYLTGWLMSEFPFTGKENVLLERMIYEGKIKYLLARACPGVSPALLMGYTDEQYQLLVDNQALIWKTIVERKHLYTPDRLTTNAYFEEQPARFIADNLPGNIGTFIGWQIIENYMRETKNTPAQLMQNNDAQNILSSSRFKP